MIRDGKTFFVGFVVVVVPLLGVPLSWKFGIIIFVGLCLVYSSIDFSDFHFPILYKEKKLDKRIEEDFEKKTEIKEIRNENKVIESFPVTNTKNEVIVKSKTPKVRKKKTMSDIKSANSIDF